jgi:hypothetical protein
VVTANKEQDYKENHRSVDDSFLRYNVNISTEEEMQGLNFIMLNIIYPSGYLHLIYQFLNKFHCKISEMILILKKYGHSTKQICVCLFLTQLLRKETTSCIHKTPKIEEGNF